MIIYLRFTAPAALDIRLDIPIATGVSMLSTLQFLIMMGAAQVSSRNLVANPIGGVGGGGGICANPIANPSGYIYSNGGFNVVNFAVLDNDGCGAGLQ